MTKAFKLYVVIWLICFAVFQAITLIYAFAGGVTSRGFRSGSGFISAAFAAQLITGYFALKDEDKQRVFYNVSLLAVSSAGLFIMLIIGTICETVPAFPVWLGNIICVSAAGLNAVFTIIAYASVRAVSNTDAKTSAGTYTLKTLSSDAEYLLGTAKTDRVRVACKNVYEALRYSDFSGSMALAGLDEQIQRQFQAFKDALLSEDLELLEKNADELINLINYRNQRCKLIKS